MKQDKLLKADLHIHTMYSMDCDTSLQQVIDRCLKNGINCIAIADHGTTEGALKAQSLAPFRIIVAEEILTSQGEIMGMFLKETIPSGFSLEKTIAQIRAQGGLLCIPHPFDNLARSALGGRILEEIADQIDVVEVFNSRSPLPRTSTKATIFAQKHSIPRSAGSDAHSPREIGSAYVEMPEFNGKDDFLQSLTQGRIFGRRSSPLVHFTSAWSRLRKQF